MRYTDKTPGIRIPWTLLILYNKNSKPRPAIDFTARAPLHPDPAHHQKLRKIRKSLATLTKNLLKPRNQKIMINLPPNTPPTSHLEALYLHISNNPKILNSLCNNNLTHPLNSKTRNSDPHLPLQLPTPNTPRVDPTLRRKPGKMRNLPPHKNKPSCETPTPK